MVGHNAEFWRGSLETLLRQFEARGIRSDGLHHMLVEVDDDHRDRALGPPWFERENPDLVGKPRESGESRWRMLSGGTLPSIEPSFREIGPASVDDQLGANVVRDKQNRPRAVLVKQRLRWGYLCGSGAQSGAFANLGESVVRCLRAVPEELWVRLPNALQEVFRPSENFELLKFGTLHNVPPLGTSGWNATIYQEDDGVAILLPRAGRGKPSSHEWLLLLHQIGWSRVKGLPLFAERSVWEGNTSMPLEWVDGTIDISRFPWPARLKQIPGHSFYSTLGEESAPLDVFTASVFAIQFLLQVFDSGEHSTALSLWKEKVEFFRRQEAIASDPAQKFSLMKQIEEAEQKMRELKG